MTFSHREAYFCKGPNMTKPQPEAAPQTLVLAPCRFCRSADDYLDVLQSRLGGAVMKAFAYCRECQAQGPSATSIAQAIAYWNKGFTDGERPSGRTEVRA